MSEEPDKTSIDAANERKKEIAKQMATVVCICKGINLGRVLKGMEGCKTVAEVNTKVGTGSGGCQGERCGPRIKILLRKRKEQEDRRKASQNPTSDGSSK